MKKTNNSSPIASSTKSSPLTVHLASTPKAKKDFDSQLHQKHYLGDKCQAGDYLRQVVYRKGEPVALLAWGAACYALKDRDAHIGWNPTQRAERQKLIVQNRRFLLLVERGEEPNLASQVLGASIRALRQQWIEQFHYTPLLAETFTDIESFKGTCYKAAGWIPLGLTKGFSRHRADFFIPNGKPKKLWIKLLHPEAITLLRSAKLPTSCEAGAHSDAQGVMPLKDAQIESLYLALKKVPDPRSHNTTYRLSSLLCIVVMAQMSGKVQLSEIHRFGQRLSQKQRRELGLPLKKGTKVRKIPGYKAYWDLLNKLDPEGLAKVLNVWLAAQQGKLPTSLAFDGKMIKDHAGILTLVDTENGVARAMIPMRHKEEGADGELSRAQELFDQIADFSGQTLSGDALHCQRKTAQQIVEKGGDYLLQIKNNQPKLFEQACKKTKSLSPLLSK